MDYNYNDFKEDVKSRRVAEYSRVFSRLISELDGLIDSNMITNFYPKNLYNDIEEKEFIFLTENKVFLVKANLENQISIISFEKLINRIELISSKHQNEVVLTVNFKSGDVLILNSKADSNENWVYEYSGAIREFYRELIK
ncbi:DUF3908 family protein [Alkalihalobacillus trypoxylicola]|uniref:Uncharacterized protein n=1 Tax=Alkalihalobacillus trypoxylicola TaxID=519424 RepID=A0A161PLU2_9BACI|nr:DUF3908 family protein [Alkalihalobacillus trypoxylicola]KYG34923.1 hypothetical protein AZF04_00905 [Alkalihalobacillus trypoxylicola]